MGVQFQGFHYVRAAQQEPRECSEEEFLGYLEQLIRFLKPGVVEKVNATSDEVAAV